METNIRAHELPPSEVVCRDGHPRPRTVPATPNYLSYHPRLVPKNRKCFENDGPGSLSSAGVRHDNDFVNVRDIRILPTTDEILSLRAPYMPYKRFNKPHFLDRGPERIIDTLFRQLRHDNVERLKDCVYAAAQKLCSTEVPPEDYEPCQETPGGNRYYMYWGAQFEDLRFEDRKGLIVQFSYNCPKSMRGRKIFTSGRFEKGMLMAAVGLDDDGVSLSATFFEVFLPQCTESMEIRGGNGVRGKLLKLCCGGSRINSNLFNSRYPVALCPEGLRRRHYSYGLLRSENIYRPLRLSRIPETSSEWILPCPEEDPGIFE